MSAVPDLPIFARLSDHATKGRIAVHDVRLERDKTFQQLLKDASSLSKVLKEEIAQNHDGHLGGARIAFLFPNGYAFVVALFAIWAASGIAVPLCITHPPQELKYTVVDSQATFLLAHHVYQSKVEELLQLCPNLCHRILKDDDDALNAERGQWTLVSEGPHIENDSRALIIYTSGTTGAPKGVVTTHKNIEAQINALKVWKYSSEDRIHHVLPLHHIHGILNALLCVLHAGGTVEMWEKFNDKQVWHRWLYGAKNFTLFMAVPTIYNRLIRHYENLTENEKQSVPAALAQFRVQISGSAALPTPVKEKWKMISGGQVLLERYGMSELGMIFSNGYAVEDRIDGTVGRPLPGAQVRLIDEAGVVIEGRGQEGDLLVKGDMVFKEYWGRSEATNKEFTSDGWFKTGDKAIVRDDGFYAILGRSSIDIIKSGGEKLSALDVEREIAALYHVTDVAVLGIEDPDLGQRVSAVIVSSKEIQIKELRNELRSKLAPYKLPTMCLQVSRRISDAVELTCKVDSIPKNAMGKVQKKDLSKIFDDEKYSHQVQKS